MKSKYELVVYTSNDIDNPEFFTIPLDESWDDESIDEYFQYAMRGIEDGKMVHWQEDDGSMYGIPAHAIVSIHLHKVKES